MKPYPQKPYKQWEQQKQGQYSRPFPLLFDDTLTQLQKMNVLTKLFELLQDNFISMQDYIDNITVFIETEYDENEKVFADLKGIVETYNDRIRNAVDDSENALHTSKYNQEQNAVLEKQINAVHTQINDIINHSGNTDAEVVAMRTDSYTNKTFPTAGTRLDDLSKVLNRTEKVNAMVNFLFDDNPQQDLDVVFPLAQQYGVPFSIAVITRTDNVNFLSHPLNIHKLQYLERQGCELLNHTQDHFYLTDLTYGEQEYQMVTCTNEMVDRGLKKPRGVVYPYGAYNQNTLDIARKHFDYGVAIKQDVNDSPIDTYALRRIDFSWNNPNNNLAWYKEQIDKAVERRQGIIFMGHSAVVTDGRNWFDGPQQQLFTQVIEYCQSINVPIVNTSELYEHFKNIIDSPTSLELSIGVKGNTGERASVRYEKNATINHLTKIKEFPYGTTKTEFLFAENYPFPERAAGTLKTMRYSLAGFSYQEWRPFERTTVYKRTALESGEWDKWSNWVDNNVATLLLTEYDYGTTVQRIVNGGLGLPNNATGLLITHKTRITDTSVQMWLPFNTGGVFTRGVLSNGSWGVWKTSGLSLAPSHVNYTTSITEFNEGFSIKRFSLTDNQPFPINSAGVLVTVKTPFDDTSYQEWHPFQSTESVKRFVNNDKTWSMWSGYADKNVTINSPISAFPDGTSKKRFITSDGQPFPHYTAGQLITIKSIPADTSVQFWIPFARNGLYRRFWNVDRWSDWQGDAGTGTTQERPSANVPNGTRFFDTDINKLILFINGQWVDVNGVAIEVV